MEETQQLEDIKPTQPSSGKLLDSISSTLFFPPKSPSGSYSNHTIVLNSHGYNLICYYEKFEGPSFPSLDWFTSLYSKRKTKAVVFFHGNGECVDDYVESTFFESLMEVGQVDLFLMEYRGYASSQGKPLFVEMFSDLDPLHEYLVDKLKIRESDIILFGRSMGSFYAVEFARKYPGVGGLILECGLRDPEGLLLRRMSIDGPITELPPDLRKEIADVANNSTKLSHISPKIPVLILHAEDDNLIPVQHARDNYDASSSLQKKLQIYPIGQHNYFHAANQKSYEFEGKKYNGLYDEIGDFISQC